MIHPTHAARIADRARASGERARNREARLEVRRWLKAVAKRTRGPIGPDPDAAAHRRLYVTGYHPPIGAKREPTPFVVRQWKQAADFKFRGRMAPVEVSRRSKPKRGPGSFRATKAARKRARRLAAQARARAAIVEKGGVR